MNSTSRLEEAYEAFRSKGYRNKPCNQEEAMKETLRKMDEEAGLRPDGKDQSYFPLDNGRYEELFPEGLLDETTFETSFELWNTIRRLRGGVEMIRIDLVALEIEILYTRNHTPPKNLSHNRPTVQLLYGRKEDCARAWKDLLKLFHRQRHTEIIINVHFPEVAYR